MAAGAHSVFLLDGLPAQDDFNGWDINTAPTDFAQRSATRAKWRHRRQ